MKRILSLLLGAALTAGLVLPAAAAQDTADARLAQVTQSVKETLDLDTEGYSTFYGEYGEGELAPTWYLYWEGEEGYLSISALEDGTIVDYSRTPAQSSDSYPGQGMPTFPQGDPEQAQKAAQAFLDRVLESGVESVELESAGTDSLNSTTYRFSGTILLHGLPSPMSCSITVRGEDNLVTRFHRDAPAATFLGDIPDPQAQTTRDQAAQSLQSTLSLRLEYILPDGESTRAVLCYLPNEVHEYYVDGKTGELVDLTALEEEMYRGMGGGSSGSASDSAATNESFGDKGLSQAEQEGIRKLEGVLSSQELDEKLREVSEYGLKDYELVSSYFSLGEEQEDGTTPVSCTLRYSRAAGERVYTRTFWVDARTGQVDSLSSYLPREEDFTASITREQAQEKAEAFLKSFAGDRFDHLAIYTLPGAQAVPQDGEEEPVSYSFRFARQENGYFFPEQYYTVTIDAADGSVCGLYYAYDQGITFDSPDGIISADQALEKWMDTYEVTLGYLLVPQKLEGSDAVVQRLQQMGLTHYYYLKLGYGLEREEACRGIDAKTGQPLAYSWQSQEEGLSYTDVDGHWSQDQVLRLARFGVGYEGGTFQPDKALTQWELVCLLYSLNRSPLDPAQADSAQRDAAYAAAYELGALTQEERDDQALVTRGELVQCLLNGAGYGTVARLEGIFTCAYPDRNTIPADELGYAALAQGLGLVSGSYSRTATATRAQAAVMLCRLLER